MANTAHAPTMIGLGEVLWDCFEDTQRPGGAPANVAFHARQLGLNARIFSRVGSDKLGKDLLRFLEDQGVPTGCIQQDDTHPTGTVTVHMDTSDAPSYTIHENVAWDYMQYSAAWRETCQEAAAICFGTLAQRNDTSRETIARCLKAAGDALKICDVNLRPPYVDQHIIETSLHAAHVAKMNIGECAILSEMLETGGADTLAQAQALCKAFNMSLVCITRGDAGCLLVNRSETVDEPGTPVEVADAVGAGDAFTAALAYGLLYTWPLARVASFANHIGGRVAASHGAMPNLKEEFNALKKEFTG